MVESAWKICIIKLVVSVCTALYLIARSILKQKNVNFQFFCLTAKTSACFGISLNNDGPLAVKEQIFLLLFLKK